MAFLEHLLQSSSTIQIRTVSPWQKATFSSDPSSILLMHYAHTFRGVTTYTWLVICSSTMKKEIPEL